MNVAEARERIRERADLNAFISLTEEDGDGPVVAVKDLVDVRGTITTAGGVPAPAAPAERDAPVARRMREFGCVVVGKTNLHEWAFGVTSQNPHYGGVRNPRALDRLPGGSSGGSAAAVAAGLCDWAVGSDTGGSIRIPAAFCGVVGFKPTVGTVDVEGVVPLSRTLDTLGPLAPDVRSAARALEMMSELAGLVPDAPRPLPALRVAVARGWGDGLAPEVAAAWERAAAGLPEIDLPDRGRMGEAGLTILLAEAAAFHRQRLAAHPERFGDDVRQLLEGGLQVTRREYVLALLEQSRLRVETEAAMEGWDAVLTPATRVLPPLLGAEYDRADITGYTRPFNTTGQPVIALPAPVTGVPVGIQVVGHFGQEAALVEVALAVEAAWRSPVLD
ncbi:MAG TPA: amidase [Candidatus Dormibacteraeota bacterium]|nr:amidase [Candidatus Dormibacteraeota bacterium]